MKTFLSVALIVCCFLLHGIDVCGETYKWVDENGVIHFQDRKPDYVEPSKVETLSEDDLKFHNYIDSRGDSEVKSYYRDSLREESSATKRKRVRYVQNQKVELYATSWCAYCRKARAFFNARGISFVEYDIEKDKNAALRHKKLNRRKSVPVAVINGKIIVGFVKSAYESALKKR